MGTRAPRGRELLLADGRVTVSGQPLYSQPEAPVFDQSTKWINPIVSANNAELACVLRKTDSGQRWVLAARNPQNRSALWSQPLPAEPVRWAIAVDAQGRIVVSLRNGQVLCFGRRSGGAG